MELLKTENLPIKKILWAVDPFHENPKDQLQAGRAIKLLFHHSRVSIEPVAVLHLGRFNPQESVFLEDWSSLAQAAQANIEKLVANTRIKGLEKPNLLQQQGWSTGGAVQTLLAYAIEQEADAIVVSTHARKGAVRFFIGSFAETLAHHSPLPVLILNPKTQPRKMLKQIIFPTDFSKASNKAFDRVVSLAKDEGVSLLLFHKLEPMEEEIGYTFIIPPLLTHSLQEMAKKYHKMGELWVRRAKTRGVDVKFYLDNRAGYTLDEILKVAKRGVGTSLIAMASQSGPIKSKLPGSLTRQLIRQATCPVLIIHPHEDSLTAKMASQARETAYAYSARPVIM